MRNNKLFTAILILQGVVIAGLWAGNGGVAHARPDVLPDPGARQLQMIDELKAVNVKLDRLATLLQAGEIKVTVKEEPKK